MNIYDIVDDTVVCSDCREPLATVEERAVRICRQCLQDQNTD